ncbi:lytic transglycosylase domain-containing protein [uncultured Campylobacter sp.]|uniref:lytic transglycosylase domain-containing protein n=1 Tax=uncultured Campylobacter sp. TaxID=218934 RepID=UPI002613BE35|nr:lytic transglycosylase domain-containing protein [uncultured Campylobacter sp.]
MKPLYIFLSSIIFATSSFATTTYNKLFIKYGKFYDIPAELLWGIAKTESNFNAKAYNKNKNGTFDIGLMQINSVHKAKLLEQNLDLDDLYEPETNIRFGAKILRSCIDMHGFNYKALNCYNGKIVNNPYNKKVLKNIRDNRSKKKKRVLIKF